jgi:hypothetical protein
MRLLTIYLFLILVTGYAVLTDGCKSDFGNGVAEQIAYPISLAVLCDEFWNQNHRWPKDYVELSEFVQRSRAEQSDKKLMLDHYTTVVLTQLEDGNLEIYSITEGVTNLNYTIGEITNHTIIPIPK